MKVTDKRSYSECPTCHEVSELTPTHGGIERHNSLCGAVRALQENSGSKLLERLLARLRAKADDDMQKVRDGVVSEALYARAATLEIIAHELEVTLAELRDTKRAGATESDILREQSP